MRLAILTMTAFILLGYSTKSYAQCQSPLFNEINTDVHLHAYHPLATAETTTGNKIGSEVLLGSEEIFKQHYRSILKAKKQVLFQTWKFDHSSLPALYLKKALQDLTEKRKKAGARTPVKVWLLINITGLQNRQKEKEDIESFIFENNLVNPYVRVTAGIYKANFLGANHVKNLIVDNNEAIVTGANFSHNFNKKGMFDAGWIVRGSVAHSMSKDFHQIWRARIHADIAPIQMERRSQSGCLPVLFTRSNAFADISSTPQSNSINWALMNSVDMANKTVDIFTPSLNVEVFKAAIVRAIKRGLKVRIILSKYYESFKQSLPTRGGVNVNNVTDLYRKLGVYANRPHLCNQLQIKWYSANGRKPVTGSKPPASHVKYMVVDDQVTYMGSHNMDNQSWVNSREIGLFVDSRTRAKQWRNKLFEPAFARAINVQECGGPEEYTKHRNSDR